MQDKMVAALDEARSNMNEVVTNSLRAFETAMRRTLVAIGVMALLLVGLLGLLVYFAHQGVEQREEILRRQDVLLAAILERD